MICGKCHKETSQMVNGECWECWYGISEEERSDLDSLGSLAVRTIIAWAITAVALIISLGV